MKNVDELWRCNEEPLDLGLFVLLRVLQSVTITGDQGKTQWGASP